MKILFCYDGSSQAENAVRFGVQIAAACQAESSILAVTVKAEDENALRNAARHVQDVFKEHGIAVDRHWIELAEPIRAAGEYRVKARIEDVAFPEPSGRMDVGYRAGG